MVGKQYKPYEKYKTISLEWAPRIPEGWEVKKLSHCLKYTVGFTPDTKEKEFYGEGYNWVTIGDLNGKFISETKNQITQKAVDYYSRPKTKKGSLLYSFKLSVGQVAYAAKDIYTNEAIASFFPSENIHLDYLYYLSPLSILQNASENIYGAKILNQELIDNSKLLLPSKKEQEKIAKFLDAKIDAIDALVSKLKEQLKLINEQRNSLITEAVCKGLNPKTRFKDSGIKWLGNIPANWEAKKIKYLFKIKKDIAGKVGYDILSVTQKGIKIKDISANEGQIAQDYSKYQLVNKNDFIMNHMDLLTGFVDCSPYDGVTSPDYRVFRLITENNRQYFTYLLQQCYTNKIFYGLGQGVSGFGRWRLPAEQFNNFIFPVPPISEQNEIVKYLDARLKKIDLLKEKTTKQIELLKEYKISLITNAVTGKIDVRNEVI